MTFSGRVAGVLRLRPAVFEEIEADEDATKQAFAVVVLASVAVGAGAGLALGPLALVRLTLAHLVGWILWAAVTYVVGAKLLPEPQTRTSMGELLRVIGFSYAPSLFKCFAFVPGLGRPIEIAVAFWLLAATVVAARQALDYKSTRRAVAVVGIGWLFFLLVSTVAGSPPADARARDPGR